MSSTVWLNQNWFSSGISDDVYLIKLTKSKLDRDLLIINKDAKDKEILLKDRNSLWKPEVVITI